MLLQSLEEPPSLHDLVAIAPFVHRTTLGELVSRSIETGEVISFGTAIGLAPFVGKEAVSVMIPLVNPKPKLEQLTSLAPFVRKEVLRELVSDGIETEKTVSFGTIISLAPFVGKEMTELMLHFVNPKPGIREISSILPFISRSAREEIIEEILGSSRKN